MKNLVIICRIFLLASVITSCSKDFLNKKSLTEFSSSDEWGDPALTATFINGIYNELPAGVAMNAGNVDESRSRDADGLNFNNMVITQDDGEYGNWSASYRAIRHCNVALENISKSSFDTSKIDGVALKDRMIGEVHFLRAYLYFRLTCYHGGVPIITNVYGLEDNFKIAQSSYADCIKFVVSDLDSAANLLPITQSGDNDGRATKGAALALKSRVLLYAASDLHNPNKNASVVHGFAHPELLGYTDGDPMARWQAAKDAAKAVIDLGVYSLYKPNPASAAEATQNYGDLFTSTRSVEDIFVKYSSASTGGGYNGWVLAPNGWYGNAGVGAINELVDAYEMADGSKFSRNNPAEAAQPYSNRDSRFYATVLFEGNKYRPRPADLTIYDPIGVGQFGTWQKWDNAKNQMYPVYGLDTRNSIANSWNGNECGATMLKYLSKTTDIQKSYQDLTLRWIRYGEVLLNYAEASIELGQDAEARTYINMIRKRAFMPDVTESGAALRDRYRNERRIEMAYEDQRFFDVRRWMIGPDAYHDVHGVQIVYKLNPDHSTATIPTVTPNVIRTGKWDNKAYFLPITRSEMNKNDKLIELPGY
ncbi:RagB/SusD family nutrient uptake outer membrane protein [Segetibacter koreensis]|uniref:RagB/SusD family nutrient uptake outer membrane protein n=1 Tax=Segetibacter koreensis TaxID=398037 RepID=UPI000372FC2F|nr:RagB/SusD family nutrient uptake outer membrane protein [Segetibacter koreensis]